ncbi:MAG: hypothetical protein VX860_06005 [Verrucomicrobiota bacterium]|nr:hypothetical protein [Verrucomicrobiota bacterium]
MQSFIPSSGTESPGKRTVSRTYLKATKRDLPGPLYYLPSTTGREP